MRKSPEYDDFNAAMDTILKADPKVVKEQMEEEKQQRKQRREVPGNQDKKNMSSPPKR